jgi:hypothetical protein
MIKPAIVAIAVAPALIALLSRRISSLDDECTAYNSPVKLPEFVAFILISTFLLFTQFFQLNYIPHYWDTEFCPFRYVYWPKWSGIMLHEAGYHPQTSAGLSWNFLLTLLGHVNEPDRYFLYLRFLSTGVAATKFILLFFFARWMLGTFGAFLSVAILGFGPPENWWSREPFLHQLPGLVAIPLLWSWIAAWQKPTWGRFTLLGLAMALMRFVYPSGMFLAFGPLIFFGALILFQRRQWLRHGFKMLPILVGIGFWLTWRTIARGLYYGNWTLVHPLEVPGMYAPQTLADRLKAVVGNLGDVFSSVFLYQVNPTHWTVPLTLPPVRCTTSLVVVLALLACGRMLRWRSGPVGFLLVIALALSFLPGVATEMAARRTGVSFLILTIIAAREASYLTGVLRADGCRHIASILRFIVPLTSCLYLAWISTTYHFLGQGGPPPQVVRGKMMREEIEDDALIVFLSALPNCDTFYSFFSELKSRECRTGYVSPEYEGSADTQELIDAPSVTARNWVYRVTEMKQCYEAHKDKNWRKIIFLVSEASQSAQLIARLRAKYPNAPFEYKTKVVPPGHTYKIFVLTVDRTITPNP